MIKLVAMETKAHENKSKMRILNILIIKLL